MVFVFSKFPGLAKALALKENIGMDSFQPLANSLGGFRALKWIRAWRECAGPALLTQVQFAGLHPSPEGLELRLKVPDPLWKQELEYQKKAILRRFNETLLKHGYPKNQLPSYCSLR